MPRKGWKGSKQETGIKQGRPIIGVTKKISLTLPEETWEWIYECIDFGHAKGVSELIRQMVQEYKGS